MDKKTLKALEQSITKWDLICHGTKEDRGVLDCELCNLFYENFCIGCPVAFKVKDNGCYNTPYFGYTSSFERHMNTSIYNALDIPGACDAAEAEIEFLISLLPENHKLKKEDIS